MLDIARRRVLATLARTNPGNELIQSAVITGLPLDIRELDLDWDTTFDLLAAKKAKSFGKNNVSICTALDRVSYRR